MKKHLPFIFIAMLSAIGCILFTNMLLFANEQATNNITVTATIRPIRIIVVDETLVIKKIISNTSEEVRPLVVLGEIDGKEIAYSDTITTQYELLKPSLNFTKAGIIYERESRPVQAIIKSFFGRITKALSSPL